MDPLAPFHYLARHPGKDVRSQLITAFNTWLKVPAEQLDVVADVVGMLHTASLMIDDIQDNAQLRRGIPVAHHVFGVASTINAANMAYFLALDKLRHLEPAVLLVSIFAEELLHLHQGQGMDILFRDHVHCPTEQEYLDMVQNKTGGLFRLAVRLMLALSPAPSSPHEAYLLPLVNALGIHFQLRDDYINLTSTQYADAKGFCEDLTEGKFSYPILIALSSPTTLATSKQELEGILRQRTSDMYVKQYAVRLLYALDAFQATRQRILDYEQQCRHLIAQLGGNPSLEHLLDMLATDYATPFQPV